MNNFNISVIEKSVAEAIRSWGVASAVYNNRPKATLHEESFVVVKVAGSIEDRQCIGEGYLEISLFAKDVANRKNNDKLGVMYDVLRTHLPAGWSVEDGGVLKGDYIFGANPYIIADVPDDYGYHARIIKVQIILKVI